MEKWDGKFSSKNIQKVAYATLAPVIYYYMEG